MNKPFSNILKYALKFWLLFSLVFLLFNCVSVKPTYNADEQAKAERAVENFHKLYNEQKFDELYEIFAQEVKSNVSKDTILTNMRESFAKTGKIRSAILSQAKILPNPTVQVRMVYIIQTEKVGSYQEWFIWSNQDGKSQLLQIQTFPTSNSFEEKESNKF